MSQPLAWPFVGNTRLGRLVLESWLSKSLPAVMVWRGPADVGKASAANWLAQVTLCQRPVSGPCGTCQSCRQVLAGSHPAVVSLAGSVEAPITIDHVRQAAKRFRWTTNPGEHRWWIMTDAEHLTEGATNAILKFFEEPPSDLHIILTSAQPDRLLPTVLSRAAIYFWHTVTDDELTAMRPIGAADSAWQQLMSRAAGRPGRLHRLIAEPQLAEVEAEYRDLFIQALSSGQPARLPKQLTPAEFTAILTTWELVTRELLLAKIGISSRRLWPSHPAMTSIVANINLSDLLRFAERYLDRYQLLDHNVQPRFILEDLQLV